MNIYSNRNFDEWGNSIIFIKNTFKHKREEGIVNLSEGCVCEISYVKTDTCIIFCTHRLPGFALSFMNIMEILKKYIYYLKKRVFVGGDFLIDTSN